jgi:hypothetical protein
MSHRVAFLGVGTALAAALAVSTSLAAPAAKLNNEAFIAACSEDEVVTGQLGAQEATEVTPKQFCGCVAGKYQDGKLTQKDVDMLTKMHRDAITDEDSANYPTLEDLLSANERFEDACKKSLGLPVNTDNDDQAPGDEEMPADEAPEGESE